MRVDDQLIEQNIHFLEEGLLLVRRLSDDLYCPSASAVEDNGVGSHLRHCLDHYFNFLEGATAGVIDYDARLRDPRVEADRQYAVRQIEQTIGRLRALAPLALRASVLVKLHSGGEPESEEAVTESTLGRELLFLISHTVHHYALIAMLLRARGFQIDAGFGVAPSTLKYRRSLQA